jgi:uncharacterized membrane protein YhhN
VVVYVAVIGAMVVSAIGGSDVWGAVGALSFLASDSLIAEHRFVAERASNPLAVIVTYHLALAALVLSLL